MTYGEFIIVGLVWLVLAEQEKTFWVATVHRVFSMGSMGIALWLML